MKNSFFLLILLFILSPVRAWKVVPILSYSSSSGVLLGGVVNHNMVPPFNPFGFSTMSYVYTDGSVSVTPRALFSLGRGLASVSASFNKNREQKFYGWGNGGSHEEYATYASEDAEFRFSYSFSPLPRTMLTLGAQSSHTTVYDRSATPLWNDCPTDLYGSLWTAGPHAGARVETPWPGYLDANFRAHAGDGIFSWGYDVSAAFFAPVAPGTTPCLRIKADRHVNTEETAFPLRPTLGGNTGLRGYGDGRFSGEWSLLANLEVRQKIFTYRIDENNSISLDLVLFGDAGQVADEVDEFRWERNHLDGGLGARISLPGGGTLRADFALSPEGLGVQMGLGELF